MASTPRMTDRIQSGVPVEVADIEARLDELETRFDERGFSYIAVNGWLIPSLDGNPDARELMALRDIHEQIGNASCTAVAFALRQDDEAGEPVCELNGRYFLDGYLYAATAHGPALGA